jgi:hypothetical protein
MGPYLDGAGEEVTIVRQTSREWRTIEEDIFWFTFG